MYCGVWQSTKCVCDTCIDHQIVIYEHSTARSRDPAKKFRDLRQASPSSAKREMGKAHWGRLIGAYVEYEVRRQNDPATSISHQLRPYQALLEREALSQGLLDDEVTALDGAVRRLNLGSETLTVAPPPYEGPAVQHANRRADYRSNGSISRVDTSDGESMMTLSDGESFYDADDAGHNMPVCFFFGNADC